MRIIFILLFVVSTSAAFPQTGYEPTNAAPGDFARMGFLPRNIAMGNASAALTSGELSSFYNPAGAVFQEGNSFQAASTYLTLDRSLNYLSFTRKFEFFSKKDTVEPRVPRAVAGVSAGVIHSGVSEIDGRDNQGLKTGPLSTMENLYFVSLSNRITPKLAVGFSVKIYHYRLYDQVSSTATGFDAGIVYRLTENLSAAFVLADLNAKYKWDTAPLYGNEGTSTTDKFPTTKRFGICYKAPAFADFSPLVTADAEFNSYGRKLLRFGVEAGYQDYLVLRGGLDNYNVSGSEVELPQPAAGFTVKKDIGGYVFAVEYAFVNEEYSRSARHVFGLNVNF